MTKMWVIFLTVGIAICLVWRLNAVEVKVSALRRIMDAQLNTKDISFLLQAVSTAQQQQPPSESIPTNDARLG